MKNHAIILLLALLLGFSGMSQTISNYSFAASGGTFTAITGTSPSLSWGAVDDGYFNDIPIGFDFWYMGIRYTTISASTNGWLTLGADITNSAFTNNLTSGGAPRPVIAPLWDDLDIQATANVNYIISGAVGSRIFTLQFLNNKWDYLAGGSTISYQVKLYEGTGKIQFVYRPDGTAVNSGSASIGLSATATGSGNFLSLNGTGTGPSASSTTETTTLSIKPLTGQIYSFTPAVPIAPTQLTFTAVTSASMTLNWLDNSANELGFVIYRSTDNINFIFTTQTAANAVSSNQTGLAANTLYYWKVMAVTEAALSSALTGNQLTLCASSPAAPTVTTPIVYCQNSTSIPLAATGTNLLWGGGQGTVGGTNNLTTASYVDNAFNNKKTNFTTTTANVNILSVDYFIAPNQTVTGLVLSIYNSVGTILATSPVNTSATAGASPVKISNTFNYTIPAAGNYSVGVSAGSGNIGSDNPGFPITETTGTINITGVSFPGSRCYNNIRFATSASTSAPTPSTAFAGSFNFSVTQTVGGCVSTPASITVSVNAIPSISQVPTSNLISSYTFSGNANDVSGSNNMGTLQNAPSLTTDRFGIANKAYSFNGTNQYISTANAFAKPGNFTISVWFKTSTVTGGKLIGFGNSKVGQSSQYDRHLYMNNAGQIYFGVYPGAVQTVSSTLSYNDGTWHLATATLSSSAGLVLYMDGVQVGANTAIITAENYSGYWKIGYDNLTSWTSQPGSFYFKGSLDDVLIYGTALSASQVNTLYKSPDGAGNSGPICAGNTLNLSASTLSGAAYSWTGPNGFSSALQNPSIVYTAANAGVYTLQVTAAGCIATAYTNVVSNNTAGQWTGNISTDWANANNWCSGIVPTAATNVIIGAAVNMPVIVSSVVCKNLTINAGATVSIDAAGTLNIAGILTNNGTFTDNGTTNFNGTTGQQTFFGVSTFNNLTLTNSSGLLLPAAIVVKNNVTLTTGVLDVNAYNISVAGNWTNNFGTTALNARVRSVTFNGTGAQSIAGNFATTFYDLIINNTGNTVSLNVNASVANSLLISSGTFDLGIYTANRTAAGGSLTVSNNTTLKIGGTNSFPINYTANTLSVTGTVEYSGTNQTVANKAYGNLKLSSSAGAAIKTLPATALQVFGNFSSIQGAGSSVTYTAAANITVNGSTSIGTATTFNAATFAHSFGGNWDNAGTFNGNSSTVTFTGPASTVGGAGAQNFNNITVAASAIVFTNSTITLSGNLATTGPGSFSQSAGGTIIMTGTGKTITGSGISPNNLTVSGTVTTSSALDITGNLLVSGSFTSGTGVITLSGTSKTISGAGTKDFGTLSVPGSITTDADFSILNALTISGTLSATAGSATFKGTSTLGGTANLFNTIINGTSLQLSSNAVLGIANLLTITAGTLDVTTSTPNTVNFNGSGAQNINAITYGNLVLSNGNTKTAIGNFSTNYNIDIATGTTFNAASYTISVYGNWINAGTFAAGSSTVQFLGPATAYLNGATTFNILTSNTTNSSTVLILQSDVTADLINMINGKIITGVNTITITGSRTGNGDIYGYIRHLHAFTTGEAYAFKNAYNTIVFASVSSVPSITVFIKDEIITDFPFGGGVNAHYTITVPSGTYNATLRLAYEDDELNGNDETTMTLWNYIGSSWVNIGKTANDAVNNYVEQSGLTNINNRWTFSSQSNIVEWNGNVSTDWNTAGNWTIIQGGAFRPPTAADIVNLGTVNFNNQPTISNAAAANSIHLGSTKAVTLTLAGGGSLTTEGNIDGDWTGDAVHTINANDRTLTVKGDLILSDDIAGQSVNLNISTGTINVLGILYQAGDAAINFTGAGFLNLHDDYTYGGGVFNAGTGTVTFNGDNNQDLANVAYYNLVINKASAIASFNSVTAVTVSGDLTVSSGELQNLSNTTIMGNVTIASGAILQNNNVLHVGGNWLNNGTFTATGASIYFDGSGTQTISSSTFNNLFINKPVGSVAILTGDVTIKGNLTGMSGTLDIGSYHFNRQAYGGSATMTNDATLIIAADNAPTLFATYDLSDSSTVIFNGTATQHLLLPGLVYGNLIFRNSGQKILQTPITVNGNLTIENNADFDAGSNTITLLGNWVNSGTFTPSTSTLLLNGVTKTVTGSTIFNRVTVYGSYTLMNDMTFNDKLIITIGGSLSGGSTILTTINGDLTNSGTLMALGTTTFTGNILQTVSLIGTPVTVAITVNFNGTVSPVLNSTAAPQFGYLNINNTGGVNPSVGWTILNAFTVGTGASFNGGNATHNIMGAVTNNGTITSDGVLNFLPATAATINLGNNFTSTGLVVFGGAGALTLAGSPISFYRMIVTNTNATGITPSSNWTITNNLFINSGSILNAGNYHYAVGANLTNNGTINSGSSTFTLNGTGIQDIYTSSAFNNLTINKASGAAYLYSNMAVNNLLNFTLGKIHTGTYAVTQPAAGTITGAAQNTGWVYGTIKKNVAPSYLSKSFEVGDSVSYTPVSVVFSAVSAAGDLTVFTTAGDHADLASSPVNESKTVNRYWTILNSGIAFSTYDATFNFVASDIDAGVTTAALNVVSHNGSSWSIPVTASPNPTNITATGLTSFDHFVVGEICNKGTSILYAASPYCTTAGEATVTLTGTTGGTFSADPGLSINAATGAVNLSTSVVGTYNVNYSVDASAYCGSFFTTTLIKIGTAGLWTGSVNSDWSDVGNWSCGGLPTNLSNVVIPNGMNSYPVITTTQTVHDLTIESGATVTVNNGALKIYGAINNSGIFNVLNGTIDMSGSSAQTIPAKAFLENTVKNLVISNDVSLQGTDTLTGTLSVASGKTFTTNDYLTLKSNSIGTARIDALPVDGSGNATAFITGKIIIERYIAKRNAWRLLSAPLNSTNAPSINAAWQEGVTTASANPDILPGYGVFIQGGTTANGFDQGLTSNPSCKVYNNASNTMVGLPAIPGTNAAVTSYPGYFLFVRGNRGIDLMQGTSAAITATTLRMKGQVNTGNVSTPVNATNYTVFGNPYPSAIDFGTITKNNVRNGFYAWDPKLSGNYGLGGYVTVLWDAVGKKYDFTASVSPVSQYIPSGEAVMVQSDDSVNAGSMVVKESDKTSNGNDSLFGRSNGFMQQVRVNLLSANANGSTTLIDGILTTYDDDHVNVINSQDAKKLTSGSENVGIKRDGKMLAIERRKTITANDTTFLNLYQMKIANYQLEITTSNMQLSNTVAVIKDSYNNTINNMPLDMNGITSIPFSINSDPASYAINRFSIVFKPALVLPVTFTTVKAYPLQKNNVVEWTTENELNIRDYEVEKSADGSVFAKINTVAATASNGGTAAYKYTDNNPFDGNSYYRIRSSDIGGQAGYSKTVMVNRVVVNDAPSINVYPNPVVGQTVSIQFKNIPKGNYLLQLFNAAGQLMSSKTLLHNGTATTQNFEINEKFSGGKYELKLTGQGVNVVSALMKR